jgi:hypothetical protein
MIKSDNDDDERVYDWTDLGKSIWTEPYHPQMLKSEYLVQSKKQLKGAPNDYKQRQMISIRYDRSYPIRKVANSLKFLFLTSNDTEINDFCNELADEIIKQKNERES